MRSISSASLLLALVGGAALAVGCPTSQTTSGGDVTSAAATSADPLRLTYDPETFSAQPRLLERIRSSPFAYFRYLAGPFARTVCDAHGGSLERMPTVSLHGDAHVEQYAVADDGFGIVDFDDAIKGPPILDWLRFSTSLWLTAINDEASAEAAILRFVDGYRRGLRDADAVLSAPEPAVARRVRAGFDTTPREWLDHVSALIQPLDEAGQAQMKQARDRYITAILAQNPDLTPGFFELKKGGALTMGVGSAHQIKFLVRVEGPTTSPDDDVILEKKQMKHLLLGPCVRGDIADPQRVIAAQSKFSRSPQRLLGYVDVDGDTFYVHAWRVHYTELRIEYLKNPLELAEIAYDFGLQLGRGHPLLPATSAEGKREREIIGNSLDEIAPTLVAASRELAQRTTAGFEHFRTGAP